MRRFAACWMLVLFSLIPLTVQAGGLRIELQPFITEGLERPVYLTHGGDGSGRIYIVEQGGTIRVAEADGTLHENPFLDITEKITSGGERGLLGLAFHPEYAENGFFYVNYTDLNGDTVIERYQVSGDSLAADPDSALQILFIEQPAGNHNGGLLKFGLDGYLYIGMGDGGGGNSRNSQLPDTLLGKMLRIDVDNPSADKPYDIPADNPFVDDETTLPEIWAFGLRNPWRWSFDRETGDLYIGDVGAGTYEEVSYQPADSTGGENYGWPLAEGTNCRSDESCSDFVPPLVAYEHGNEGGCVVTGGYVYRGEVYPLLQGVYFFADYCSGRVWAFLSAESAAGNVHYTELLDTDYRISSFGEDEAGELYVVNIAGGVYRIVVP